MSNDRSNIIPIRRDNGNIASKVIINENDFLPIRSKQNMRVIKIIFSVIVLNILFFSALIFIFTEEKNTNKISNKQKETTSATITKANEQTQPTSKEKITVCVPNSPFPTEEKEREMTCISN